MDNIDFDRLRRDLVDYYGSAMFSGFPMAIIELTEVENASDEELINLAKKAGISINKYIIDDNYGTYKKR